MTAAARPDAPGSGVHYASAESRARGLAACGALLDAHRPDYREDPRLVLCPACRWWWLADTLGTIAAGIVAVAAQTAPDDE